MPVASVNGLKNAASSAAVQLPPQVLTKIVRVWAIVRSVTISGPAVAAVAAAAFLFGGEDSSVDPTLVNGALRLPRVVLGGQLVICAHPRRKLTGANFSGKTRGLTRGC